MTLQGCDSTLHDRVLKKLLIGIMKESGSKLVFKGGTCAYLFYDLPRLSLDLDFDLLEQLTEEELDSVKVILGKQARIRQFSEKKFTTVFLVSYEENAPNIKIELNKQIWQNNNYRTVWFLGVKVNVADESTLMTNKIIAITDRKNPVARDIFDAYYFLKMGYPLNRDLIAERTGKGCREYLVYLACYISKQYTRRNILQGLGELLDASQKEWAKRNLIEETISLLKMRARAEGNDR